MFTDSSFSIDPFTLEYQTCLSIVTAMLKWARTVQVWSDMDPTEKLCEHVDEQIWGRFAVPVNQQDLKNGPKNAHFGGMITYSSQRPPTFNCIDEPTQKA
jgi:hypothetical protein